MVMSIDRQEAAIPHRLTIFYGATLKKSVMSSSHQLKVNIRDAIADIQPHKHKKFPKIF